MGRTGSSSRKKIEEEGDDRDGGTLGHIYAGMPWPLYGCFRSVKARASSYYSIIRVNAACAQLPSVRALL